MIRRFSKLPSYLTQAEIRALLRRSRTYGIERSSASRTPMGFASRRSCCSTRDDVDLERGRMRIRRLKGGLSGERPIFRNLLPLLRQYLESRRDRGEALFTGLQGRLKKRRIQDLFRL